MIETLQARDNVVGGVFQHSSGIFWCFWKGGKGIRSGAGLILRWSSLSLSKDPAMVLLKPLIFLVHPCVAFALHFEIMQTLKSCINPLHKNWRPFAVID